MSERDVFPPSNLSDLSIPWGRAHDTRLVAAEEKLEILGQGVSGQNRNTASSLASLGDTILSLQATIASMPITYTVGQRVSNFSLSNTYAPIVTVRIPVPAGRNTVSIFCVGNAGVLDAITGGVTTSYGRIVITGGTIGSGFPASKDAGASQVMNVISATLTETNSFSGDWVEASFELRGLNGSAFPANPDNFAQISLLASFL